MKKLVVSVILMVVLILGTSAMAEIDLSGMTAEELNTVIKDAGTALKAMEPLEDDNILYDKYGYTVAITETEIDTGYGHVDIRLHLIVINDTEYEAMFRFTDVAINGWAVETRWDNETKPKTKTKNGVVTIENIFELADISSFEEIESIEAYGYANCNDEYRDMHYIMTYTSDKGIKIIQREEIEE